MKKNIWFVVSCLYVFAYNIQEVSAQILRVEEVNRSMLSGISGVVSDTSGRAGVPYAHVFFIHGTDTARLAANVYGRFVYKGRLADTMRVRVTAVGYRTLEETYVLKQHGACIRIQLHPDVFVMNELIIMDNRVAMVVKGDTLQYNAEAFTALEGDFMEVLLKKIPGISYAGGVLSVNGEPITRVYVNGSDALFKNAKEVFENVKADNVKDIKIYDEKNEEDQRLGMKYGRKETVMDVTTKRKVNAVRRSSVLLGSGVDVSPDRSFIFKEKYNFKLDYNTFSSGESVQFSGMYTNVSPYLEEMVRQFGGKLDYRKESSSKKWKYNTSNLYDNKTIYLNRWSEQEYFPTEYYDVRCFENKMGSKNRVYSYQTRHQFDYFGEQNVIRGDFSYVYQGNKREQTERSLSSVDGIRVAEADVTDYLQNDFSGVTGNLVSTYSFSRNSMLSVFSNFSWQGGDGEGWRVDTLNETVARVYLDKTSEMEKVNWTSGVSFRKKTFFLVDVFCEI